MPESTCSPRDRIQFRLSLVFFGLFLSGERNRNSCDHKSHHQHAITCLFFPGYLRWPWVKKKTLGTTGGWIYFFYFSFYQWLGYPVFLTQSQTLMKPRSPTSRCTRGPRPPDANDVMEPSKPQISAWGVSPKVCQFYTILYPFGHRMNSKKICCLKFNLLVLLGVPVFPIRAIFDWQH